ncbi:carboxypeptidase B-like [Tubulanus polymorphus]|uniref:carboxypeptidase B-like n=1 Tax=Tubulanus polymorphus TaxID=672921 RepID=UPI003DA2A871
MQKLIDEEKKMNSYAKLRSTFGFRSGMNGLSRVKNYFLRLDEINEWLDEMAAHFSFARVVSIGRTYEGRDTKALIIGSGKKPAIFIDSGIHAREWVSVSTNLYLIYQLLAGYESMETRALIDQYDWYFVPVANPDGYEYTHTHKRMWRKNRRPMRHCVGADPNRNFDINFGGTGTSGDPCSDIYRGPHAFSEPCALNLARFLLQLKNNNSKIKAYMSLHAYSQMWFTPYAYDRWLQPDDIAELKRVANIGASAIYYTHGRRYTVGSPGEILYEAAGSSMDWVKAKAHIKYSFAMEMRPDRYSYNGFIVPPSEIVPAGEEMFAGIKAMAREMR